MSRCTPCAEYRCGEKVIDGKWCPKHEKNHRPTDRAMYDKARKENDPYQKQYSSGPFVKLSRLVKAKNMLCQRVIGGVQCTRLSQITHHRISPHQDGSLFLCVYDKNNVSQLIALCREHHPDSDGTPTWKEGVDFVRTEFRVNFAKGGS